MAGSTAVCRLSQRFCCLLRLFYLASVSDLLVWVIAARAAKAQIEHDVFDFDRQVLSQIGGLLQHRTQNVAVVRVTWERACAQYQAVLV